MALGVLPLSQFGGYYVNAKTVPPALRWIPSVSLIKHGFEGLCDNEFPGLEFESTGFGTGDVRSGDQVTLISDLAMHAWRLDACMSLSA